VTFRSDGLRDKQMPPLRAINYSTVEFVDDTPPVIDPKARILPSRNIAVTFDMEKLEWCGYQTVNRV